MGVPRDMLARKSFLHCLQQTTKIPRGTQHVPNQMPPASRLPIGGGGAEGPNLSPAARRGPVGATNLRQSPSPVKARPGAVRAHEPPPPPQPVIRDLRPGEWDAVSGVASAQGPRPTMEDRHTNADDGWMVKNRRITNTASWPRCAFYGVFDGHGGARVASVASTTLWKNIQESLATALGGGKFPALEPEPSRVGGGGGATARASAAAASAAAAAASAGGLADVDAGPPSAPPPPLEAPPALGSDDLTRAMESAFELTEADVLSQAKKGRWEDGCTAVCVLLFDRTMVMGNLGDSRAVLCSDGKAIRLTEDHKPNTPSELARIQQAGGFVKTIMGIPRLGGDLSLSRAFGDQAFKKAVKPRGASPPPRSPPMRGVSASPPPRGFQRVLDEAGAAAGSPAGSSLGASLRPSMGMYVRDGPLSAIPDVSTRALEPSDEFLLLACDGVWDVFSDEVAVKHVQAGLRESHGNPHAAGEYLVDKVLRSARCTDNVSVIVVLLRWGSA